MRNIEDNYLNIYIITNIIYINIFIFSIWNILSSVSKIISAENSKMHKWCKIILKDIDRIFNGIIISI